MTTGILIARRDDTSASPVFFSIGVGRFNGGHNGWTVDRHQATAFARRKDAEEFSRAYLPYVAEECEYIPAELSE